MAPPAITWQAVQSEALRRIHSREWPPGALIPHEAALAEELGCARATVNRALRDLAEAGLLERRRKAGTRVPLNPVRKATFAIPIIRQDVESRSARHSYRLLGRTLTGAGGPRLPGWPGGNGAALLHLTALHLADDAPFCFEDRWINTAAAPGAEAADFASISANEWLVQNTAFSDGDIVFQALPAPPDVAAILDCAPGAAVFAIDRQTWAAGLPITAVRLTYAPGYRMVTAL